MQKGIARFISYTTSKCFGFPPFRGKETYGNRSRTARAEFNTVKVLTCTSDLLFVTHTVGDDSDYSINVYIHARMNSFFFFLFLCSKNGR